MAGEFPGGQAGPASPLAGEGGGAATGGAAPGAAPRGDGDGGRDAAARRVQAQQAQKVRRAEDAALRTHCEHRFKSMMPPGDVVAEWYEIAGLCMPSRSRALVEGNRARLRAQASSRANLYDGYPIRSFEICANGMLSGLSSRSRPWRKSVLEDEGLMDFYPVRVWLEAYDKLVYSALAASNFYEALLACYGEMAGFGTGAILLQNHDGVASPKLVAHALTVGEYGIALGEDLRPDALARSFTLTARQMVGAYVTDRFDRKTMHWDRVTTRVREAWDKGNYEQRFTIRQLIEPNPAWVPGRIGRIGMRYRSMKWEAGQDDRRAFLAIEGYRSQPFMAPRWETLAGDVWGTGRGKKALPDMRALQLQAKRKGEATDMVVKPPTWGPPTVDRVGMLPGNHTTVAALDMNSPGIRPVYALPWQTIEVVGRDVVDARQAIDRMTYADLFMAITNMAGVQPRNMEELMRRHEEQLTQLGPVTDRANVELLQVASDRIGDILDSRGDLLNVLPPPPQELQGAEIRTDFVSVLAQAQRMLGIGQTERAVSFVGNLAAAFPGAADNIDPDEIVRDYWERSGAVSSGLRDPRAVAQMREQRAQAQQAEQMAAMMPAVKDGAEAARLLSEADASSGGALAAMLGGGGE
ncbi:portal protein [Sphingomonas sp. HF-S3]|uniref:Portal protein n=1 Tax=Sphingomonas rustica TaxID=3103142 RepID=A0ABV0BDI1_9SPHN